jgi:hypothetical protein
MRRDVEVEDATAVVGEHHEDEQQATGDRRPGEEIDGHQRPDVILKEGPPRLGGRATPARQEPRDGALGDVEAKLEQFTVDARCTPQGVGCGHLVNQVLEVVVQARAAADLSRSSGPIPREPAPMPADNRGRAQDHQGRRPAWPQPTQCNPEPAIGSPHRRLRPAPLIHPQLLTQRQVLEDERAGPAAEQNHDSNSPHQPGDHRPA